MPWTSVKNILEIKFMITQDAKQYTFENDYIPKQN